MSYNDIYYIFIIENLILIQFSDLIFILIFLILVLFFVNCQKFNYYFLVFSITMELRKNKEIMQIHSIILN